MKLFPCPPVVVLGHMRHCTTRPQTTDRADQRALLYTVVLLPVGVVLVSSLLWAAVAGLSRPASPRASDAIYTVAAVRTGLEHAPGAWVNRTVRVRAILAQDCNVDLYPLDQVCRTLQPALFDADATPGAAPFPVVIAPLPPHLLFLRHFPLVDQLVPAPQYLQWGTAAVYRVQFRAEAHPKCHATTCYEALLPDVAPGSQ